jgi:hypothetical protein
MSEEQTQICPWCQTEIVWDPEFGVEEYCPHCTNELKGYRTMELDLDSDVENDEAEELTAAYEEAAEEYVFAQEEVKVCTQCQSNMIFTGQQEISAAQFKTFVPSGMDRPFLSAPFALDAFTCPNCFQLSYQLDEKSKQKLKQSFQ